MTVAKDKAEAPKTDGWRNLKRWMNADKENTVTALAKRVGVATPSAHAWVHRISRPTGTNLIVLVGVIGGTVEDWMTAAERKADQQAREKAQRGAA